MANAKKPAGKSPAGKGRGGNVVVDLGEEIDKLIAGKEKKSLGAAGKHGGGWRPPMFAGGFMGRPGFGFRPGVHRSQLGMALEMPAAVDPMKLLGGTLAGVAVNRVLYRAIPYAIKSITSELLVNGISAGLGIVPYLARKNAFTIGFAVPGVLTLAGSLVDALLGAVKVLPKPALTGPSLGGASPALASARQTIDAIRARMAARGPGVGYAPPQPVRVATRPQVMQARPVRVAG